MKLKIRLKEEFLQIVWSRGAVTHIKKKNTPTTTTTTKFSFKIFSSNVH